MSWHELACAGMSLSKLARACQIPKDSTKNPDSKEFNGIKKKPKDSIRFQKIPKIFKRIPKDSKTF